MPGRSALLLAMGLALSAGGLLLAGGFSLGGIPDPSGRAILAPLDASRSPSPTAQGGGAVRAEETVAVEQGEAGEAAPLVRRTTTPTPEPTASAAATEETTPEPAPTHELRVPAVQHDGVTDEAPTRPILVPRLVVTALVHDTADDAVTEDQGARQ